MELGAWVDKATLKNFAAKALAHPKRNEDHVVGTVTVNAPPHVIGYARVVNSQEVRKNLKKHGDPTRQIDEQPPIAHADFDAIPHITRTGSFRVIGTKSAHKPQRIEYRGSHDGKDYVYLETVGAERRRLALLSFYRLR